MPVYDVAVDIPERPVGEEIEVPPFGTIKNGETKTDVEMSVKDAERFKEAHGITLTQTSARKTLADEREEQEAEASTIEDAPRLDVEDDKDEEEPEEPEPPFTPPHTPGGDE